MIIQGLMIGTILSVFIFGVVDSMTNTSEVGVSISYDAFNIISYVILALIATILFRLMLVCIAWMYFGRGEVKYEWD